MDSRDDTLMHGKDRLQFSNNDELRRYYESKYSQGGYERGFVTRGVNVSAMYHAGRRRAVLELLGRETGLSILDAGCGNGEFSADLAAMGHDVCGVDIAANAFAPEFAGRPRLRFQQANLETLPFPDASFDRVVCVEAVEHLLTPQAAMREFRRVLKPGGRLVMTYPTINRTAVKRAGLGKPLKMSEHLNEWSYAELVEMLDSVGLKPERSIGVAFDFGYLLALKMLSKWLALQMTRAALAIRNCPRNSMFVVLSATRP